MPRKVHGSVRNARMRARGPRRGGDAGAGEGAGRAFRHRPSTRWRNASVRNFRLRAHHLDRAHPAEDALALVGACDMQNSPPGAWEASLANRTPSLDADGAPPPVSHFDTAVRDTYSLAASCSCVRPRSVRSAFSFSPSSMRARLLSCPAWTTRRATARHDPGHRASSQVESMRPITAIVGARVVEGLRSRRCPSLSSGESACHSTIGLAGSRSRGVYCHRQATRERER